MSVCISLLGTLVLCLTESEDTRRFMPVTLCFKCLPLWLRSLIALRRWKQAVTCWGLASARRRAFGGRGGGGREHSPGSWGDPSRRRADGRGDAGTAGGGGGPALECSFLRPERLRTGVEDSSGWGFAPLPPPHPRAPFQALSGRFQNRAGKFKEQRGACAVGRDNGRK